MPVSFTPFDGDDRFSVRQQALRRVIGNLADNALKFGHRADIVLFMRDAGTIEFCVRDDGPGIPERELQAVMEPFYRLENSRSRHTGGTGLGLAIASQLVGQMNGTLTLSNLPQGGLQAAVVLREALL